ncbi:MAG: endonuclease domain-containing protein [bacterium]|nr:endonuclease domain-containing protein [bacterium]
MLSNNKLELKQTRKRLRNSATPQEVVLWARLRRSQFGYKFKRQASIGNYVVDFYCPEKKLAIEVDGSQHIDSEVDKERTRFLEQSEISVLRFWNNEVNTNLEGVLTKIVHTLES